MVVSMLSVLGELQNILVLANGEIEEMKEVLSSDQKDLERIPSLKKQLKRTMMESLSQKQTISKLEADIKCLKDENERMSTTIKLIQSSRQMSEAEQGLLKLALNFDPEELRTAMQTSATKERDILFLNERLAAVEKELRSAQLSTEKRDNLQVSLSQKVTELEEELLQWRKCFCQHQGNLKKSDGSTEEHLLTLLEIAFKEIGRQGAWIIGIKGQKEVLSQYRPDHNCVEWRNVIAAEIHRQLMNLPWNTLLQDMEECITKLKKELRKKKKQSQWDLVLSRVVKNQGYDSDEIAAKLEEQPVLATFLKECLDENAAYTTEDQKRDRDLCYVFGFTADALEELIKLLDIEMDLLRMYVQDLVMHKSEKMTQE